MVCPTHVLSDVLDIAESKKKYPRPVNTNDLKDLKDQLSIKNHGNVEVAKIHRKTFGRKAKLRKAKLPRAVSPGCPATSG